jgi:integrase
MPRNTNQFDNAKVPEGKREILIKDEQVPGLYMRVTAGARSWVLQKRLGSKVAKMKLGDANSMSLVEARVKASEILKAASEGHNPYERLRSTRAWELSVADLFERYHAEHLARKAARPAEAYRLYELHWGPLRTMTVARLTTIDIQKWVNDLGARVGKATANKQFSTLRACLRWAQRMELIFLERDPCSGVQGFRGEERTRYLQPGAEYKRLSEALAQNAGDVADVIWLLLFTGARKSNVLAMEWKEIDWTNKAWMIPPAKAKARKELAVPLTDNALKILERRRFLSRTSPWVFPANSAQGHIVAIDKVWKQIRLDAGLQDFKAHDLRHTVGTWLGQSNASAFTIQNALGHASVRTSQKYVHRNTEHTRQNLEISQEKGTG